MTTKKNGGTKAENVVKGKGKAEDKLPKGLPVCVGMAGSYLEKFGKGDYADATPIRTLERNKKLKAVGTYGKLKAYIVKSLDHGLSLGDIGEGLEVSGSRIRELIVCLGIPSKPKAKKNGAEFAAKMKAAKAAKVKVEVDKTTKAVRPKAKKAKVVDAGDEGDV